MVSKQVRAIRVIAARLLNERLPEDREHYPKTTPRKVIRAIEKHNEQLRQIVCELIDATEEQIARNENTRLDPNVNSQ